MKNWGRSGYIHASILHLDSWPHLRSKSRMETKKYIPNLLLLQVTWLRLTHYYFFDMWRTANLIRVFLGQIVFSNDFIKAFFILTESLIRFPHNLFEFPHFRCGSSSSPAWQTDSQTWARTTRCPFSWAWPDPTHGSDGRDDPEQPDHGNPAYPN